MKIWYGYGSEHSMNLVMIGHFREVSEAEKAKWKLDQLREFVDREVEDRNMVIGSPEARYSDSLLELLRKLNFSSAAPAEFDQFGYDYAMQQKDNKIVITTEESDVSVFLKLLVSAGARVEVYSAHDYPDTEYGR